MVGLRRSSMTGKVEPLCDQGFVLLQLHSELHAIHGVAHDKRRAQKGAVHAWRAGRRQADNYLASCWDSFDTSADTITPSFAAPHPSPSCMLSMALLPNPSATTNAFFFGVGHFNNVCCSKAHCEVNLWPWYTQPSTWHVKWLQSLQQSFLRLCGHPLHIGQASLWRPC